MAFDYFYGRGTEQFAFYQIPKVLITDDRFADISLEAKFLYSLMLDRAALSAKNGWLDEKGRVYIYYTLEQVMADLRCANQKATKLMKELEVKIGLIERRKQGQGKPAMIYVKDFMSGLHGCGNDRDLPEAHENHESEAHEKQTNENHESGVVRITRQDSRKSCTNNTDHNNTDMSETNLIHPSTVSAFPKEKVVRIREMDPMNERRQYEEYLREKLCIDSFVQRNPFSEDRIQEILDLMVDVLCSTARTIRISGDDKPAVVVKAQFMKIEACHLEYILDCFKNQISDIRNVKQYMLATIYNAPLTIDHYYTAKVSYDMADRKETV